MVYYKIKDREASFRSNYKAIVESASPNKSLIITKQLDGTFKTTLRIYTLKTFKANLTLLKANSTSLKITRDTLKIDRLLKTNHLF